MIKNIIHDKFILSLKSSDATPDDKQVIVDLLDTLKENREICVGLAANMIGVNKRIIAVSVGLCNIPMVNPTIIKKSGLYKTEEGCLSLDGVRKTERYRTIEVEFYDADFKRHKKDFGGLTAQIIQHEIDHCNGILI